MTYINHGSDKPGEPAKPGDMINILKSQGEPGKVREKISKILQVMEESERFFDKADKPIFRLFLLKLKSKMCVLCFLHDRLLFIFDLFFNILIIGVLIVNCVLYLVFFVEHSCFQGCIAY